MPPRSTGRLLSGDGGDFVAVCWQHEYSGWKVVLDVLTEYVTRRRMYNRPISGRDVRQNRSWVRASDAETGGCWYGD
jgi:hypothetical protein